MVVGMVDGRYSMSDFHAGARVCVLLQIEIYVCIFIISNAIHNLIIVYLVEL